VSQSKRPDIQKRFEARMDVIFGGRCDDDLTLAMQEDPEAASEASVQSDALHSELTGVPV
jgi:hypothetical protein